jgi:hypothetical protein
MPLATLLMAFVCIWLSSIVAEAWPPVQGRSAALRGTVLTITASPQPPESVFPCIA